MPRAENRPPAPNQRLQRTQSAECTVRQTTPAPLSRYPLARPSQAWFRCEVSTSKGPDGLLPVGLPLTPYPSPSLADGQAPGFFRRIRP